MTELTVPIYELAVYAFTDREEAAAYHKDRYPEDEADLRAIETARGVCITNGKTRMICVFEGGRPIAVHESVHMAWALLRDLGIKVSFGNDEPLAYLTAWLAEEMFRVIGEAA